MSKLKLKRKRERDYFDYLLGYFELFFITHIFWESQFGCESQCLFHCQKGKEKILLKDIGHALFELFVQFFPICKQIPSDNSSHLFKKKREEKKDELTNQKKWRGELILFSFLPYFQWCWEGLFFHSHLILFILVWFCICWLVFLFSINQLRNQKKWFLPIIATISPLYFDPKMKEKENEEKRIRKIASKNFSFHFFFFYLERNIYWVQNSRFFYFLETLFFDC